MSTPLLLLLRWFRKEQWWSGTGRQAIKWRLLYADLLLWVTRSFPDACFQRPLFARIGRDITFLDETHILIPVSAVDSALKPGQNYEVMLLVYDFDPSVTLFINQIATIPYCFRISLPVRTGIATFRHARLNTNTASFSVPSSTQGYFHTDPKDRIIALEVTDNNWLQSMEETSELYAPAHTFLSYIAAHPPITASASVSTSLSGHKPLDVPWDAWGPHGAHLVRAADQPYILRRPRVCGMRVLGASQSNGSVVVADYHPGRVARQCAGGTAGVLARPLSTFSEILLGARAQRPKSMCVTKEVPLPRELREAPESPWMMLCEDALVAFEVRSHIIVCCWTLLRMRSMLWMGLRSAGSSRTHSSEGGRIHGHGHVRGTSA